jgi:hypothetical protein
VSSKFNNFLSLLKPDSMKKLIPGVLLLSVMIYACKKYSDQHPPQQTIVASKLTLPPPQLNTEQLTQVNRLNADRRMTDYAKACNDFFLNIVPGSDQVTTENLARSFIKPKADALRNAYAMTLFKRTDASKIFAASFKTQLARFRLTRTGKFFTKDPCRDALEDSRTKCQDDFFADLPTCAGVAIASTVFGPETGLFCLAGIGLKAMSCRNAADRAYIRCLEKTIRAGETISVYFQKDTMLHGQQFRIGASIGAGNKSIAQFLKEQEALRESWSGMNYRDWLKHIVASKAPAPYIKLH